MPMKPRDGVRLIGVLLGAALVWAVAPAAAVSAAPTLGATPAATAVGPAPAATSQTPPTTVCTISDTGGGGAVHITGLAALPAGGYVLTTAGRYNDFTTHLDYIDAGCGGVGFDKTINVSNPQDLAVDATGAVWVADTGDLGTDPLHPTRTVVRLYKYPARSATPSARYTFAYPDGAHDTSAFLLTPAGVPIFATRQITGPATLYAYRATLSTTATMPLSRVGTFVPQTTGTANKLGVNGPAHNEVTGGAVAPDGSGVVLRTLSDAYEWTVSGGDVIAAITTVKPVITPLPNEDDGESVAYTPDGRSFLTVSSADGPVPLLKYQRATTATATVPKAGGRNVATSSGLRAWLTSLTFNQVRVYLIALAVVGIGLLMVGGLGMRRARCRAGEPLPDTRPVRRNRGKLT